MEQLDIKLKSKHIAPFCKVLSKIGINKLQEILDFDAMSKSIDKDSNQVEVGMKIILPIVSVFIENYPCAEKEINTFITNVTEIKKVEELEIDEFADVLYQIFSCDSFKNFFSVVKKFMQ